MAGQPAIAIDPTIAMFLLYKFLRSFLHLTHLQLHFIHHVFLKTKFYWKNDPNILDWINAVEDCFELYNITVYDWVMMQRESLKEFF